MDIRRRELHTKRKAKVLHRFDDGRYLFLESTPNLLIGSIPIGKLADIEKWFEDPFHIPVASGGLDVFASKGPPTARDRWPF